MVEVYSSSESEPESVILKVHKNPEVEKQEVEEPWVNFKEEYTPEKEREVFLGMLYWRCKRRERLERDVRERRKQEEEWRERNGRELEKFLEEQKKNVICNIGEQFFLFKKNK